MSKKVMEAELRLSASSDIGKTFDRVAAEAKRAGAAIRAATDVSTTAKQVDALAAGMARASKAAAAANGQAVRDAAALKREVQGIAAATAPARAALDLSEPLRRDLAALQLTRREIALLARDAARMSADREKALAGVGNDRVRAQVLAAERGTMEARLRERATGLAAQRQAEEAFARQMGTISKAQAAEKVRGAREAARAAREAEREATRAASEGAQERARIARAEASAQMAAARQAARAAREGERANREYRRPLGGTVGAVGGSIGLAGAGYGAYRVVQKGVRAGADSMREASRDNLAGLTREDSDRLLKKAQELSAKYPSIDINTMHERLRDTALAMGSVDKAFQVGDTIGKSSVILQSLKGKDKSIEEGRRFFSALDALGKNTNAGEVDRLMNGWIKALGVEGADLDMGSLLAMSRTAKSGGASLNETFLTTVAPALMQDLGPERLGTALGSEVSQIIGGRATKQTKAYQQKLGMRDKKGNFLAADRDLILSDPYAYTQQRLIPMLKAKGVDIDNNADVTEKMSKIFSNQVVADLFTKMITQREQYDRKREQYGRAPGLAAADGLAAKDPYVAAAAAATQFTNVLQMLAEPVMPKATEALNLFASKAGEFAKYLGQNPKVAETTATVTGALGAQALLGPVMTMPLGVAGGAAFDWNLGGNPGALGLFTGQESDASRTARHMQDQAAGAAAARAAPVPLGWGQRRRKVLPGAPTPGKGVTGEYRFGGDFLHDFLWGQERRTLTLPGFGTGRALTVPPETFEDLKTRAAEAGTQAGEKTGQGVADGIRTKAPEVEAAGQTLFQRMLQLFGQGINMPINFVPGTVGPGGSAAGEGGPRIQTASFGGGGGAGPGGLIHRASVDGAGGFTGGTGGFDGPGGGPIGAPSARDLRDADPAFVEYIRKAAAARGIDPNAALRIANAEGLRGSSASRLTPGDFRDGRATSFGPFQLHYGRDGRALGDAYTAATGHHASDPRYWQEQIDFALDHARKNGWQAWYGRQGAGLGVWDGIGSVAASGAGAGLRVKGSLGGQAFGGGGNHPALIGLAEALQKGGGVNRFTAFNDRYHQGTGSLHAHGLATDVTGDPAKIIPNARALMEAQGLVEGRDYRILNEYARPSRRATGGHVHIEFRNRRAADIYGRGMPKAAGERALPEPPERTLPMPSDAAPAGFGGRGAGDLGAAAERMHAAAERFENAAFHGQVDVRLLGGGGRVTGMRAKGRGMTADMGVTMPDLKFGSDDDWT